MKQKLLTSLALSTVFLPSVLGADENDKWSFDASVYLLGAGMSGDVTVRGIDAELDLGFDQILDNLEFSAMGSMRVGYDRWALRTEIMYVGLGASKNSVTADVDQWIVEPTLGYTLCKWLELLGGVRYNNLALAIEGTGPLGNFRSSSGTHDWWDPIVGANLTLPFANQFSFNLRGDVGGFGVGSDLTWQAFPYVSWHFNQWGSLHIGYRWMYVDYETGSGASRFRYDITTAGPQLGFTYHF